MFASAGATCPLKCAVAWSICFFYARNKEADFFPRRNGYGEEVRVVFVQRANNDAQLCMAFVDVS